MCKSVGGGGSDGECGVILFGSMEIDMKKILKLKVISKWFTVQMCTAYLVWLYECMIHANGKNVESKMRNEEIIIERKMQIKTFRKNYYEFRNKLLLLKITKERSKSYKLLTKECNLPPYRRNKWNEENAGNKKNSWNRNEAAKWHFSNEFIFNLQQSSTISYWRIDIGIVIASQIRVAWELQCDCIYTFFSMSFEEKGSIFREREKNRRE